MLLPSMLACHSVILSKTVRA